jgi:putative MATE family efflux protein
MERATRLGTGSISSLLLTFSTPAIVGMVAQALYNIVDRVFVGQAVGLLGIAGTTLAFPFMLVLMALSMLFGFGAAALVSIRLGERRHDEAEQVLGQATTLLLAAAGVLTILGLTLLDPLLWALGASEQSHPYARDYLQIILGGCVFQTVGFGLNAVIRAEGNTRVAMFSLLIGALLNALLNPLFLFVLRWGMRGSALATVLSQAVSATWVVYYFLGGKSLLRFHVSYLRLRWDLCRTISAFGSPMFAIQMAGSVMNATLNHQLLLYGGDLAISVMGIVHAVMIFFAMPIFGLNQGVQPIIGYNYGAAKYDRVLRTLELSMLCATVVCVAGFLVVMLAPSSVVALFHRPQQPSGQQLMQLGTHALRICAAMFPVVGCQIVGAGYFQAVGRPKQALLLGLSRQFLLLIPAIMILPRFLDLDGVWIAIPTADVCSSVLTGTWLFWELRHLRDRHGAVLRRQLVADGPVGSE